MSFASLPVVRATSADQRRIGKEHLAVPLADGAALTICGTRMPAWVEVGPESDLHYCGRCWPFFGLEVPSTA